jgi:hypothetical protein
MPYKNQPIEYIMSQTRQNLAAARELVLKHLEGVKYINKNHPEEIELFMELLNHITTIMTQSGWSYYTEDSFANYWEKKEIHNLEKDQKIPTDLPLLTQQKLIDEAKKITLKTTQFTYEQTQKLFYEVRYGRYTSLLKNHFKLMSNINLNIFNVIKNIDPDWKQPTYNKKKKQAEKKVQDLPETKINLVKYTQGFYYLTSILNGFYIPLNQTLDPLNGISEGYCFGHVLAWADEISKKGRYTSAQLSASPELDYVQLHQNKYKQEVNYFQNYRSPLDLYEISENIIKKLDMTFIFNLVIWSNNGKDCHGCGIRKIPITNEIEFFDPNFGLFVFKTGDSFRLWFPRLIEMMYFKNGLINNISLKKIKEQKNDATLSIPLMDIHPLSDQDKEKIYGYLADSTIPDEVTRKLQYVIQKIRTASYIAIHSEQKDLFKKTDDSIYKMMLSTHQLLKNNSFLTKPKSSGDEKITDEILASYKKNIDAYHSFLKKQVFNAIDKEISILDIDKTHPNEIIALIDLKESIHNAGPHIILAAIIDQWLLATNKESKISHYNLIKSLTKTYEAVSYIRFKFETSPFMLHLLQDRLLLKILIIIEGHAQYLSEPKRLVFFHGNKKIPGTLEKVKQCIFDYTQEDKILASEVLEKISVECRKKDTDVFANILSWRNIGVAFIYNHLKKIKPHNSISLISIHSELNGACPTNNLTPPPSDVVSPRP